MVYQHMMEWRVAGQTRIVVIGSVCRPLITHKIDADASKDLGTNAKEASYRYD